MVKKTLLAMLLFFVAVYFILTHYFGDVEINKYDSKATAQQEQAIERGWIPAILPESAYEISETHNLDTNELFGSFYYKDKDEKIFMENLTLMPDMNDTLEWGNFLFRIDQEKNHVKYRNKADIR
jgi:hypothetical protein